MRVGLATNSKYQWNHVRLGLNPTYEFVDGCLQLLQIILVSLSLLMAEFRLSRLALLERPPTSFRRHL